MQGSRTKWVKMAQVGLPQGSPREGVCEPKKGVPESHENPLVWGTFLGIVHQGFFFLRREIPQEESFMSNLNPLRLLKLFLQKGMYTSELLGMSICFVQVNGSYN